MSYEIDDEYSKDIPPETVSYEHLYSILKTRNMTKQNQIDRNYFFELQHELITLDREVKGQLNSDGESDFHFDASP
jgi:hypothetical protein